MTSLKIIILSTVLTFNVGAFSESRFIGSAPENNQSYSHYFFFSGKISSETRFVNPNEFTSEALNSIVPRALSEKMNLISWQEFQKPLPLASESYDRKRHFGTWIVDKRKGHCLSTRAEVLLRDSKTAVGMIPGNNCTVAQGKWLDPYGNRLYTQSKEVQIDHMVPLKHAYIAGGWKWNQKLRCLYANYLGYRGHLVTASGAENRAKGDATPYSYLPPSQAYVCTYLAEWLRIKLIWNLALIPPEVQAIVSAYKKNNCSSHLFDVSLQELKAQRKWIKDNANLCDYDVAPRYSRQADMDALEGH